MLRQLARVGLTGLQLVVGAVGGWFVGAAALFSTLIASRIVGIAPKLGDLVAMGVVIGWAVVSVLVACAAYNRHLRWTATVIGFSVATIVFAFFAVAIVIPFGASMRDFD